MAVRGPLRSALSTVSLVLCALFSLFFSPRQFQHSTGVVNIEVPVRVFDGDRFVENLTIDDFDVLEDGKPQRIVGLYLIKKTDIRKETAPKALEPVPAQAD